MPLREAIFGTDLATLFGISASSAYLRRIPSFLPLSIAALMWRLRSTGSLSSAMWRKYYAVVSPASLVFPGAGITRRFRLPD